METPLTAASEIAIATLRARAPLAFELAAQFKAAGFRLALVGGPVRDSLLGRLGNDLDFTTDARPEDSKNILKKWAEDIWDVGIKFGTIGAKKSNITFEVTTYRADSYESDSRKPEVNFGDTIEGDLLRRDFTVNAMAIELTTPTPEFIDPHNGVTDLLKKLLRTPSTPELSCSALHVLQPN
jgi:poly(A) polymerase